MTIITIDNVAISFTGELKHATPDNFIQAVEYYPSYCRHVENPKTIQQYMLSIAHTMEMARAKIEGKRPDIMQETMLHDPFFIINMLRIYTPEKPK